MDDILMNQNIGKWNEACRFLKGKQSELSVEEWTAVELLSDFWRDREFDNDLVSESKELIEILLESDKLHASNLDIKKWSKEFRSIAKLMYTKDKETYEQFRKAMKTFYNQNRQSSSNRPSANIRSTQVNTVLLKQNVQKGFKAIMYLAEVNPQLSKDEFAAVNEIVKICTESWNDNIKERVENCISILFDGLKLHSSNKDIIIQSKELISQCKQYLLKDRLTFEAYCNALQEYAKNISRDENNSSQAPRTDTRSSQPRTTPPPPPSQTTSRAVPHTPAIRITSVEFINTDKSGNLLVAYNGLRLYGKIQYLTPILNFQVLDRNRSSVDIWYKIISPNGTLLYANNSKNGYTWHGIVNTSNNRCTLSGFGSASGTTYQNEGDWIVEFYEEDMLLYKTKVNIKTAEDRPRKKSGFKKFIFWSLVVVACYFGYRYYTDYKAEQAIPRGYVFADNLFIRSSKTTDEDNSLGTISYGAKVKIYSNEEGWAYVSAGDKEGFVSSDYLLSNEDFTLLNNIWKSESQKEEVNLSRQRLSILDYLKSNSLKSGNGKWTLSETDNILQPYLKDEYNFFPEFGFVLKNDSTGKGTVVLYGFDKDEKPIFRHSEEVPDKKSVSYITYNRWTKKYDVAYTGKNVRKTVTSNNAVEVSPIEITSISFSNNDYNGNIIDEHGDNLYSNVKYLTAKFSYKKKKSDNETFDIQIRITDSTGKLLQLSSSPANCSFKESITLTGTEGRYLLSGFGNNEGNFFFPGKYKYEILYKGKVIGSAFFEINEDTAKSSKLHINSVVFSNNDYNGNVIDVYGAQLYDNTKYLKAKLNYRKYSPKVEAYNIQVKIIGPDGNLYKGSSSPENYTFEERILLKGTSGFHILPGWGNNTKNIYPPGTYKYEIWRDKKTLLHSSRIEIKKK